MICEECGLDRASGSYYIFHYGNSSSLQVDSIPGCQRYMVTTHIVGEKRSWICRSCVIKRIAIFFAMGMGFGVLLVISWLVMPATRSATGRFWDLLETVMIVIAIFSFMLGIWGFESGIGEIGVSGENIAIETNRSELQQAGFDTFLNGRKYRNFGGRKP